MLSWSGSSTTCGGEDIIAGYANISPGGSFSRTYSLGAAHNSLEISFKLFAIDNWDPADQIDIQVGGESIPFSGLDSSDFPSNICGGAANDL